MTIEQVIEAKEMPWQDYLQVFGFYEWATMFIAFPLVALFITFFGLVLLAMLEEINDGRLNPTFAKVFLSVVFIASLSGVFAILTPDLTEKYEPENWREDIAVPFYESIPKTVHEIDIINIQRTHDPSLFEVAYAEKNDDGTLTHESVVAPIEKSDAAEKPTYKYKVVTKEIPNFKDEGKHEEIIILPADYPLMIAPASGE